MDLRCSFSTGAAASKFHLKSKKVYTKEELKALENEVGELYKEHGNLRAMNGQCRRELGNIAQSVSDVLRKSLDRTTDSLSPEERQREGRHREFLRNLQPLVFWLTGFLFGSVPGSAQIGTTQAIWLTRCQVLTLDKTTASKKEQVFAKAPFVFTIHTALTDHGEDVSLTLSSNTLNNRSPSARTDEMTRIITRDQSPASVTKFTLDNRGM
ncbi:hypothetical protein N7493_007769 [Penicillium malachiteum]|uniref:Uncharacterized protein n=1 Tax=Penicillium malachiteum TaxID=1324776 RepID=A0AAD6HIE9_9EURO|nr:hypothetical protein N7493_007769 [Penicillium malachiteum]